MSGSGREPIVQLNGWTLKLTSLIQIVSMLAGGFAAWYSLSAQVQSGAEKIAELTERVETARRERIAAVDDLKKDINSFAVVDARTAEQIANLNLLLGDLKRKIEGRVDDHGPFKQGKIGE